MKIQRDNSKLKRQAGFTLIECLTYMVVFLILSGVAMASFYLCWDHSKALITASDDIGAALRAGERWRADVRQASGSISIESIASGEIIKIPEGENTVLYRFDSGKILRQAGAANLPVLLLPKVKSSEMKQQMRGGVTAWRWDLELVQRRKEIHTRLLFMFEAVSKNS
jgi:prepilin-type N-terminal cleavage/methylation domain-containing protein